jgi:hypothetical protein
VRWKFQGFPSTSLRASSPVPLRSRVGMTGVCGAAKEKANLISQTGLYLCRQRPESILSLSKDSHTLGACSTIGPAGLNLRRLEGVSARSLRAGAFCRNPERSSRRISGSLLLAPRNRRSLLNGQGTESCIWRPRSFNQ